MRYLGTVSHGKASAICWPVHVAVGFVVTLKWMIFRLALSRTRKTYRTRKVAEGRVKKSIETMSDA